MPFPRAERPLAPLHTSQFKLLFRDPKEQLTISGSFHHLGIQELKCPTVTSWYLFIWRRSGWNKEGECLDSLICWRQSRWLSLYSQWNEKAPLILSSQLNFLNLLMIFLWKNCKGVDRLLKMVCVWERERCGERERRREGELQSRRSDWLLVYEVHFLVHLWNEEILAAVLFVFNLGSPPWH